VTGHQVLALVQQIGKSDKLALDIHDFTEVSINPLLGETKVAGPQTLALPFFGDIW
jgi:hypothetical protein